MANILGLTREQFLQRIGAPPREGEHRASSSPRPELRGLSIRINRAALDSDQIQPSITDYLATAPKFDMIGLSAAALCYIFRAPFENALKRDIRVRVVIMDPHPKNDEHYSGLIHGVLTDEKTIDKRSQALIFKKLLDDLRKQGLEDRLEVKVLSGTPLPHNLWIAKDADGLDTCAHLSTWMFCARYSGPVFRVTDSANPLMKQIRDEFEFVWSHRSKEPDWSWEDKFTAKTAGL